GRFPPDRLRSARPLRSTHLANAVFVARDVSRRRHGGRLLSPRYLARLQAPTAQPRPPPGLGPAGSLPRRRAAPFFFLVAIRFRSHPHLGRLLHHARRGLARYVRSPSRPNRFHHHLSRQRLSRRPCHPHHFHRAQLRPKAPSRYELESES